MDANEHIVVWDNCLRIIGEILEPQKFDIWFKPLKAVSFQDSTLTLEVPSDFFREYLDDMYLDLIKMTLKRVIGAGAKLVYRLRPVQNSSSTMTYPSGPGVAPTNKPVSINNFYPNSNPGTWVFAQARKFTVNPRLNPVYSFSNMIEGDCNRMGITAGKNISLSPGDTPFNPLFIFGGPGLGKTHLAQAIGISIKEKYPDKVVLYVTGHEFKMQFMDAIAVRNKLTDFMAYYMKMDVIILDDIQGLQGQSCQNAFFSIFNHLHENHKQLIFTSDRPPVDLQNFEERLLSRMKWGLNVELQRPSYQTRLDMLRAKAFREGIEVDDEVLSYLAANIKTNFRELEGAFISLMANATLGRSALTIELASHVTGNIIGEPHPDLTMDQVQRTVCEYFNISRDTLLSKSRKRGIVQARQIAMYMSRNLLNCSLSTIGQELGGKDHATVVHACTTVQDLMATDKTFRQYVLDIEKLLQPGVEA